MEAVVRELGQICGPGFVRPAGAADTVAGTPAKVVAAPGTVAGMVATLRSAVAHDLTVVPRGAGTKLDWGAAPSRVDLLVDTGRLAGVWHHSPAQRAAEVGAGTPLRAAQARLARSGQRLALDPASADATVGGVVATDEAGPLRHRSGGPADQLIGVSYVRADGVLAHSGSRPGGRRAASSDVTRLLCGSYGALGVLVSATFRVEALPATRVWVSRSVWTPLEVHDLVEETLSAGLDAAAIEVNLPAGPPGLVPRSRGRVVSRGPGALAVLLEGATPAVEEQSAVLLTVLGGDAAPSPTPPDWWRRYPFGPDDIALRLTAPRADLHAAIYALRDAAGTVVAIRGSPGAGVVYGALSGRTSPQRAAAILDAVRGVLLTRGGSCVVLAAPPRVRAAVDLWGQRGSLPLLRQVKDRFDPDGRLAPGRYIGGI
jgi:glycolate oxidase FAD binding subunit